MITEAQYISIWDGGMEIPSSCRYDTITRRCFDIEGTDCGEGLEHLDAEVVELMDGTRLGAAEGVSFDY